MHLLQYWRQRYATLEQNAQDKTELIRVSCAALPETRVCTPTLSFFRSDDGHIHLSVSGIFNVAACKAALELLP